MKGFWEGKDVRREERKSSLRLSVGRESSERAAAEISWNQAVSGSKAGVGVVLTSRRQGVHFVCP